MAFISHQKPPHWGGWPPWSTLMAGSHCLEGLQTNTKVFVGFSGTWGRLCR